MKKNLKYKYAAGKQINEDSGRIYDVAGFRLPSVTSILSRTKDQGFLKEWMITVGGMQQDGLSWTEAMGLCRSTMEMPDDVYNWLLERKRKEQVTTSFKNSEAF